MLFVKKLGFWLLATFAFFGWWWRAEKKRSRRSPPMLSTGEQKA